jgi:hypothetical protein
MEFDKIVKKSWTDILQHILCRAWRDIALQHKSVDIPRFVQIFGFKKRTKAIVSKADFKIIV